MSALHFYIPSKEQLQSSSKSPGRGAAAFASPGPGAGWSCRGVMAQQLWKSRAVIHWVGHGETGQEVGMQGQYSTFPLGLGNFLSIAEVTGSV